MIQDLAFSWVDVLLGDVHEERGAVAVPATVRIGARERRVALQLDTGVFHSILYSNALEALGDVNAAATTKGGAGLAVRLHSFADPELDPMRHFGVYSMTSPLEEVDGLLLAGTLGLDALMGQVSLLDFEQRRFAMFPPSERDSGRFSGFHFTHGRISKGYFFLECSLAGGDPLNLIFDTGDCSSFVACSRARWEGIVDCNSPPTRSYVAKAASWGRDIEFVEAPVVVDLRVGGVPLKGRCARRYAVEGVDVFDGAKGVFDGSIGCAAFAHAGAVVLDLHRLEFGVAQRGGDATGTAHAPSEHGPAGAPGHTSHGQ